MATNSGKTGGQLEENRVNMAICSGNEAENRGEQDGGTFLLLNMFQPVDFDGRGQGPSA